MIDCKRCGKRMRAEHSVASLCTACGIIVAREAVGEAALGETLAVFDGNAHRGGPIPSMRAGAYVCPRCGMHATSEHEHNHSLELDPDEPGSRAQFVGDCSKLSDNSPASIASVDWEGEGVEALSTCP